MRYDKIEINHEKIAQLASRARRINYFLQMHVHAASSERSFIQDRLSIRCLHVCELY